MKVLAPGKLILSGEHSVVYGQPALAMAVNRYVEATASPQLLPFISFDLSDLAYKRQLSFSALKHLKNRIKDKYKRFVTGEFKIRDVLPKPMELAQFALSLFFESVNIKLNHGIKIHIKSDIPMGCGMGSSAATILSIVHVIANHLDVKLSSDMFYQLSLAAEKIQHGYSSGLDLRVSMQGGCLYMKDNQIAVRAIPTIPMYLVNTGTPVVGTGECVTAAAPFFKNSSIKDDFGAVTESMDNALQENQIQAVKLAINANHELLKTIGVVPLQVQHFISEIQRLSGAAKICGAGAVAGEKAGVVLVVADDDVALQTLCSQFDYHIVPISGSVRGVHVI